VTAPRRRLSAGNAVVVLALSLGAAALLTRRAALPLAPLPCSLSSAALAAALLLLLGWFLLAARRFGPRAWRLAALLAAGLSLAGLLGEGLAQLRAALWPSYEVVYLDPDPALGWRPAPGLAFRWAGHHAWADEFSVDVQLSSAGWRDLERTLEPPPGTLRVALLGDSMIEALQVRFEETSGQLLERALASTAGKAEVLNFGVSAFGTGQSLLSYRHAARRYRPSVVVLLVAPFHLARTWNPVQRGGFPETDGAELEIRPTFRLGPDGALLERPARDLEPFRRRHGQVVAALGPERARRRARSSWLAGTLEHADAAVTGHHRRWLARSAPPLPPYRAQDDPSLPLGAKLVEALAAECAADGARLVVADGSAFFSAPGLARDQALATSAALEAACARAGAIREDVSPDLEATPRARFPGDGHLTPAGNAALAGALLRGVQRAVGPGAKKR
jgi:hypothetical protein